MQGDLKFGQTPYPFRILVNVHAPTFVRNTSDGLISTRTCSLSGRSFSVPSTRVSLIACRPLSVTRKDHPAGAIFLSTATHSPRAMNHVHVLANSTARFIQACPDIFDWHNFVYSIMKSTGKPNMGVLLTRAYEWLLR
jgi:hypothetical protein